MPSDDQQSVVIERSSFFHSRNFTEPEVRGSSGGDAADDIDAGLQREWYLTVLAVIPLACVIGNSLVIAAVWTTKSLQTPTNYLLVSLACADLLIGMLVMPFNIYVSVNGLHWHLPAAMCYLYCSLDVAASTASIVHLVLISIDRLVAATKPAEYKTPKHKRRVYIAIGSTWFFSVFISLPLVTGFNTKTRYFLQHEHHCGIYSPMYMLCSSIFAFYLPCLIMTITYGYIFYALRKRLRAIQLQEMAGGQFLGFGADVGNITTSAIETVIGVDAKNRNMISWEKPLLRKIEETAAEHASSLNDSEREQLQTILEAVHPSCSSTNNSQYELTTTYIEADDLSERPPSVVLEAVTLKQCHNNNSDSYASSLALEVPKRLPSARLSTRRRFSEAIQSTLHRNGRISIFLGGDSPTSADEDEENNNNNNASTSSNNNANNVNNNVAVGGKKKTAKIHQSAVLNKQRERKKRVTIRRHSYQPPGCRPPVANDEDTTEQFGSRLKPNVKGKTMRRLSEIISDWERPSRASLSQMYSFARRESVYIARKKLAGLKDWALDLLAKLKSKQGMAIRRETRATKLVATVMGVFLICWMPFFTLNMVKVYRLIYGNWPSELEVLFHWTSALGYLNSSLNFIIYSAINKKFRSSFWRLIGLNSSRKRRNKSWMLPPKDGSAHRACCASGGKPRADGRRPRGDGRRRHRHHYSNHNNNQCCRHRRLNDNEVNRGVSSPKLVNGDGCTKNKGSNNVTANGSITPNESCTCNRSTKSSKSGTNPLNIIARRFSVKKPEIIIDEVSVVSDEHISISAGGNTTYRRSSDDCIRRSSSEMIGGGETFPSNQHHESRRGSGMSNSSASLQLHDMHQIAAQSSHEAEIFV